MGKDIHLMSVNLGDKGIGRKLLDKGIISTYLHAASTRFGVDPDDPRIHEFHWSIGLTNRYDRVCDLNTYPSLSRDILEKMRPYEGMAIKLGQRKTNFPISDYETEKMHYLNHIRFWNHIIDNKQINVAFFFQLPHHQMEYVIYALLRVKSIPILLTQYTSIPEIGEYSSSIETAGENIKDYYKKIDHMQENDIVLSGKVLEFYNRESKRDEERNQERKQTGFYKKQLKMHIRTIFSRGSGSLARKRFLHQHIKFVLGSEICNKMGWIPIDRRDLSVERQQRIQIRNYLNNQVSKLSEYDKIAVEPDYSKKYIYFALQLTPELTTMPQAGVFAEQYPTIQLIARAAEKNGVLVYVKEHFVQPFRDKEVYHCIKGIPNVRLIKSYVSSFDLISHSIAVSTQTGTCILEGAFRGKPALVTGEGYNWKGLPGCYQIDDEDQCTEIIGKILDGTIKPISKMAIKKYFYAIQKKTIFMHNDGDFISERKMKETSEILFLLLKRWIESGYNWKLIEESDLNG